MRRKAAIPSPSRASGNGAGSPRAEGKALPNTFGVCVPNTGRGRQCSLQRAPHPQGRALPLCAVFGRAERGPPLPLHAEAQRPYQELIYPRRCRSVAIRRTHLGRF